MATYDFECTKCGEIQVIKGMNDPSPTNCPQCGTEGLKRLYKPVMSIWKCGGSYNQDRD